VIAHIPAKLVPEELVIILTM